MAEWEEWTHHRRRVYHGTVASADCSDVDAGIRDFWDIICEALSDEPSESMIEVVIVPSFGTFSCDLRDGRLGIVLHLEAFQQFCEATYPGIDEDDQPLPGEEEWEANVIAEQQRYVERFIAQARQCFQRLVDADRLAVRRLTIEFNDEDGFHVTAELRRP